MSHKNLDTLIEKIDEELEKVSIWLKLNKLSLNLTKTNFMLFKSSRKKVDQELRIKIKYHCITQVRSTKFLGTIIDEQLKWTEHINYIANKISRLTGILCKARHYVTRSLLKSIYYALIYPHIFYGNVVWANAYQSHLDRLYKLQKKIVRIMTFKEYNIKNIFKTNEDVHNYNTRSTKKLHKPLIKTNLRKLSISYKGIDIYNNLPSDLKRIQCQSSFKRKLKKIILTNQI